MSEQDRVKGIVNTLVAERKRRGTSQEDIAQWTGVTRQQVSHWEVGRQSPSISQLVAWAEGYGWTLVIELITDQPSEPPVDDFAGTIGRLAPLWSRLPQSARRGLGELIRALEAMSER